MFATTAAAQAPFPIGGINGAAAGGGGGSLSPIDAVRRPGTTTAAQDPVWTLAGVSGGIPATYTQCVTAACNTVSGGTVTSASVNAAIASAPNLTYVSMAAG